MLHVCFVVAFACVWIQQPYHWRCFSVRLCIVTLPFSVRLCMVTQPYHQCYFNATSTVCYKYVLLQRSPVYGYSSCIIGGVSVFACVWLHSRLVFACVWLHSLIISAILMLQVLYVTCMFCCSVRLCMVTAAVSLAVFQCSPAYGYTPVQCSPVYGYTALSSVLFQCSLVYGYSSGIISAVLVFACVWLHSRISAVLVFACLWLQQPYHQCCFSVRLCTVIQPYHQCCFNVRLCLVTVAVPSAMFQCSPVFGYTALSSMLFQYSPVYCYSSRIISAVLVFACVKPQALVYDILPPATSITDYAIGLEKRSANGQFFFGAQTAVSL